MDASRLRFFLAARFVSLRSRRRSFFSRFRRFFSAFLAAFLSFLSVFLRRSSASSAPARSRDRERDLDGDEDGESWRRPPPRSSSPSEDDDEESCRRRRDLLLDPSRDRLLLLRAARSLGLLLLLRLLLQLRLQLRLRLQSRPRVLSLVPIAASPPRLGLCGKWVRPSASTKGREIITRFYQGATVYAAGAKTREEIAHASSREETYVRVP